MHLKNSASDEAPVSVEYTPCGICVVYLDRTNSDSIDDSHEGHTTSRSKVP